MLTFKCFLKDQIVGLAPVGLGCVQGISQKSLVFDVPRGLDIVEIKLTGI